MSPTSGLSVAAVVTWAGVGLFIAVGILGCCVGFIVGRRLRAQPDTQSNEPPADLELVDIALAIVEQHPAGVVVADQAGRTIYRNLAARRMVGNHAGVLIDEAIEQHLQATRHGEVAARELELFGPPKQVVVIAAESLPGGAAVAYIQDVSEARRLDRIRTDFVANISHELRTPIGALALLAEMLADEDDPVTIRRVVTRMLGETDRATRTIDDLIELARIEADSERRFEVVDAAQVVRSATERVAEAASRRGVTVVSDVEFGAVIRGQRSEVESAVGNLVENAVKYSNENSEVTVRVTNPLDWAEITVIDHGIGIPQAALDRIFERFYRVDRARSRATGGTGLGLSIVRHIATNHGGRVGVTSEEGVGSTFVLRLPLTDGVDGDGVEMPNGVDVDAADDPVERR